MSVDLPSGAGAGAPAAAAGVTPAPGDATRRMEVTGTERATVTVTVSADGAARTHAPGADFVPAVLQFAVWPLVVLVIAVLYRQSFRTLIAGLIGRLRSISVAGVTIELVPDTGQSMFAGAGAVDIRRAGTEQNVDDSTLRGFYEQLSLPGNVEFAVVDLGTGRSWLSSRLYILSVILVRMRALRALVFVEQRNDQPGRFVGVCSAAEVRWRLASRFPRYEAALALGETRAWFGAAAPTSTSPLAATIATDWGTFGSSNQAAELLKGFLTAIQSPVRPPIGPESWEELTRDSPPPGMSPTFFEHAEWLTTSLIEQIFDGLLDPVAISIDAWQLADMAARSRLVLEHQAPWLAIVRDGGRFHGLLSRGSALESLALGASA